jgi:hypothetical protein
MPEACMLDILALSEADLKRVLPKASARSLARLAIAYPRTLGRTVMPLLSDCVSSHTMDFLREQMNLARPPSFPEIRQAESELMKIIYEENLLPVTVPA